MIHSGSGARQFQNLLERSCSPKVKVELTSLPGGCLTPRAGGRRAGRLAAPLGCQPPPGTGAARGGEKHAGEFNPSGAGAGGRVPPGGGAPGAHAQAVTFPHVCLRWPGHSVAGSAAAVMAGKAFRKFLPLFDRVLVERCAAETVTKGGIMIPEKAQGKVLQATVVAVGSGARGKNGEIQPVSVKVGEKVLLPEYGGTKIVLEDKDYYLFRDGDILGKYVD
ncbi:10 kDa heat shock protein, mitochondrial [Pluvialis apricaria]